MTGGVVDRWDVEWGRELSKPLPDRAVASTRPAVRSRTSTPSIRRVFLPWGEQRAETGEEHPEACTVARDPPGEIAPRHNLHLGFTGVKGRVELPGVLLAGEGTGDPLDSTSLNRCSRTAVTVADDRQFVGPDAGQGSAGPAELQANPVVDVHLSSAAHPSSPSSVRTR